MHTITNADLYAHQKIRFASFQIKYTLILLIKGHLCLWREDSLKEKCNTKFYKIYFYAIFRACKYVLMDKSIYLASFTLIEIPYLAGINIRDALLQNIMIMTIYCLFYFYSPVPPPPTLDPECHFDMLCECARNICWQNGMLGHGGEHTQKITTRH